MARLIKKTGFISRKSAGGYMKYIATREGVEVLTGKGPATEKQKEMVAKLLGMATTLPTMLLAS